MISTLLVLGSFFQQGLCSVLYPPRCIHQFLRDVEVIGLCFESGPEEILSSAYKF